MVVGGGGRRTLADRPTLRWCSRAPSDSATSRIGAAAVAPLSAIDRITRAVPSSTRPAQPHCDKSDKQLDSGGQG